MLEVLKRLGHVVGWTGNSIALLIIIGVPLWQFTTGFSGHRWAEMATFEITAPDCSVYKLGAPDVLTAGKIMESRRPQHPKPTLLLYRGGLELQYTASDGSVYQVDAPNVHKAEMAWARFVRYRQGKGGLFADLPERETDCNPLDKYNEPPPGKHINLFDDLTPEVKPQVPKEEATMWDGWELLKYTSVRSESSFRERLAAGLHHIDLTLVLLSTTIGIAAFLIGRGLRYILAGR